MEAVSQNEAKKQNNTKSVNSNQQFNSETPPIYQELKDEIFTYIYDLNNYEKRERALFELSRRREKIPDLAVYLWNTFGIMSAFLQEITSAYTTLSPPSMTVNQSNRLCNTLALLQCVASHPETTPKFLKAHIPLYLFPFLNTTSITRPYEYTRLTSLGVIGALVKTDSPEVVQFLLQTEIIALCLRIMEKGTEFSRTVATFIVQKILNDNLGSHYICSNDERFYTILYVLNLMVESLLEQPSSRLLKHLMKCYMQLALYPRRTEEVKEHLPLIIQNGIIFDTIKDDPMIKQNSLDFS